MRSVLAAVLCGVFFLPCFSQTTRIDALRKVYYSAAHDQDRLTVLLALLDENESLPVDSLWNYALKARALASAMGDHSGVSLAVLGQANAYLRWNNVDSARTLIEGELRGYKAGGDGRDVYFRLARARIDCLDFSDNFKDATAQAYVLLQEAEQYHDSVVMAQCSNSLAAWNYDMDFLDESKKWSYKALAYTSPTPVYYEVLAGICFNLGETYLWIKQLDSAEHYIRLGIDYGQRQNNLFFLYYGLQKIASVLTHRGAYAEAEKDALESIELQKKIDGEKPNDAAVLVLANVYKFWGKLDKAIAAINAGLYRDSIFKRNAAHMKGGDKGDFEQTMFLLDLLARCYRDKGDPLHYAAVLEKIVAAKDTLYKENSASALAELQTKYEVEKKEALIANQRLALVKDRYLQYGSIVVALLGAVIAWLVIRNMRRTAAQEAARAVSTAEETERRRIAADLHDNLGAQLSFIRRNVNFMLDKPGGFGVEDERKYLEYVNETAKAAMIDLRETIWVLNRHEVEVQEFVDKLKSYLRQQLQGQEVVRWNFSEHIRATWRLPSGEVMHLFRITQELISNVLKHSDADMIQIRFEAFEMGAYRLKVEDNGRGFDVRSKQEGHYGMENIHQRAREIGAVLVVESRLSAGTRVVLEKSNENNSFVLLHADSTSVNIAD